MRIERRVRRQTLLYERPGDPRASKFPSFHGGAVGADFGPIAGHLGRIETHRQDRISALCLGFLHHSIDHLLTTCRQVLRHPPQLSSGQRLESGSQLRTNIPASHGQSEYLTQDFGNFVTG